MLRAVDVRVHDRGSGKSSLLQVLAGELVTDSGQVFISETDIASVGALQLARMRAMLDQSTNVHFGFCVQDVVSWGRTPWRGTKQAAHDAEVIQQVMRDQHIAGLAARSLNELSGGERKRVHIARVLAQSTPVLLLDEADGDLDLPGRAHLDRVVRGLAADGVLIIQVSHDLARAAQYSDVIVAMKSGSVVASGAPNAIMTSQVLTEVFETPCVVEQTPSGHLMIATS